MINLNISDSIPTGLYIHLPFCKSKCGYCSFYSDIFSNDIQTHYLDLLSLEISSFLSDSSPNHFINTIYLGGGTPGSVNAQYIDRFINTIIKTNSLNPFEITMEFNPRDITNDYLSTVKNLGINRISLGVQSFNDSILKFLQRDHDSKTAIDAFHLIRQNKFNNVSIDLIFGIPDFSNSHWQQDLSKALELNPDHISIYALSIEKRTPFFKMNLQDKDDPDTTADQYHYAVKLLRDAGYRRYEISNFAKPDKECRHNLTYWNMNDYIGFGPTAASFFDDSYFTRVGTLEEYLKRFNSDQSTIDSNESYSIRDKFINCLIMGLRLEDGISISDFRNKFNINPYEFLLPYWNTYFDSNFVALDGDRIHFSDKGFFVSNSLLSLII